MQNDKNLPTVLGEQEESCLYDIVYCDIKRLEVLLAQTDDNGYLRQLISKEALASSSKMNHSLSFGPRMIGQATGGKTAEEQDSEAIEKTYDPFVPQVLNLCHAILETDCDLSACHPNMVVHTGGSLKVFDIQTLDMLLKIPAFEAKIADSLTTNAGKAETKANKIAKKESRKDFDAAKKLVENYSGVVQGVLSGPEFDVWMILQNEFLLNTSQELYIRRGPNLGDGYHVIGILDSRPGISTNTHEPKEEHPVCLMLEQLRSVTNEIFGKRNSSFGVTPLVILREISF